MERAAADMVITPSPVMEEVREAMAVVAEDAEGLHERCPLPSGSGASAVVPAFPINVPQTK